MKRTIAGFGFLILSVFAGVSACKKPNGNDGVNPKKDPICFGSDTLVNGECVPKAGWYRYDGKNFHDGSRGILWKGNFSNQYLSFPYVTIKDTGDNKRLNIEYLTGYSDDGQSSIMQTGSGSNGQNCWSDAVKGDSIIFEMPPLKEYEGVYIMKFCGRFNAAKDTLRGKVEFGYGGSGYKDHAPMENVTFFKVKI